MEVSRRKFMLGVGAVAAAPAVLGDAQKVFKVGLVGCGGRGTGAIQNIMDAAALLSWMGMYRSGRITNFLPGFLPNFTSRRCAITLIAIILSF